MANKRGAVGGTRIGRRKRITRRKLAQAPLRPPQIPHEVTWDRTRRLGYERLE
jgi:hypothetical protein